MQGCSHCLAPHSPISACGLFVVLCQEACVLAYRISQACSTAWRHCAAGVPRFDGVCRLVGSFGTVLRLIPPMRTAMLPLSPLSLSCLHVPFPAGHPCMSSGPLATWTPHKHSSCIWSMLFSKACPRKYMENAYMHMLRAQHVDATGVHGCSSCTQQHGTIPDQTYKLKVSF